MEGIGRVESGTETEYFLTLFINNVQGTMFLILENIAL